MKAIAKQQRGITFSGFIVVIVILGAVAIFSMKLIPAYMQNGKIQKAFDAIVRDPAMQAAPVKDIRMSFYNRAVAMDGVTVINQEDIEIGKDNGSLALSASYNVKVPVAGNVSLLIEFNPTTAK